MSVIEHWLCPGCGEIDGPRAGMTCHGPQMTGGCASVRNEVVEISHDAALRLEGAVARIAELEAEIERRRGDYIAGHVDGYRAGSTSSLANPGGR